MAIYFETRVKFMFLKHMSNFMPIGYYFASMEDIKRKCNLKVDLSKFTSNTKISSEVVTLIDN